MSSLLELARLHPELGPTFDHLSDNPFVWDDGYVLKRGQSNDVLVGNSSVIKIRRGTEDGQIATQIAAVGFEAMLIAALGDADKSSPLALPDNHDLSQEPYAYLVFSRVPEATVYHGYARDSFSPAEKEVYGRRLGLFIAWMAKAIRFEQYNEIIDRTKPKIFDRETEISRQAELQKSQPHPNIPKFLSDVLFDVYDEYNDRLRDGSLESTIVGHNDLREDNLTFTQYFGKYALYGVFDFELTGPSSPERELRHLATLGPDALEPAIKAYESETGVQLSRDLIHFWARAQTVTTYTAILRSGKNALKALGKQNDLEVLLPENEAVKLCLWNTPERKNDPSLTVRA